MPDSDSYFFRCNAAARDEINLFSAGIPPDCGPDGEIPEDPLGCREFDAEG